MTAIAGARPVLVRAFKDSAPGPLARNVPISMCSPFFARPIFNRFYKRLLGPKWRESVVATLEHKQKRFLPEDLVIYFDDVVDQIESLWNILGTQKEIIESLEDTNESLLSHNINLTMRTLTVFSAIMLPLTFLTGLFGMNVKLPFDGALTSIQHFWFIGGIMGGIAALMIGVFLWKKWL